MPEQTSTPPPGPADDVEAAFFETLREAAWIFENEADGRFRGPIIACTAVTWFIHQRGGGAELAGPFVQTARAFAALKRGEQPTLFTKKTAAAKERARSPERRVIQRLAAAALEVLVRLGERVPTAAATIARSVNRWSGMSAQEVTGNTVIAWRKQLRRTQSKEFAVLKQQMLAQPQPRATVNQLLRKGPPGLFR